MNGKTSSPRPPGQRDHASGHRSDPSTSSPLFDPAKSEVELVDSLAEEQADRLGNTSINSAQLRRFFGEVKDLFRRLEAGRSYKAEIEPLFKMMRSKASYAWRGGNNKIPKQFHDFIDNGVKKVSDEKEFRLFVKHFEAVVGFLYGKGKVGR